MPTHTQMAAQLLRGAADFFTSMKEVTPDIGDELETNAKACTTVAELVEKDPHGEAPDVTGVDLPEL